MAGHEGDDGGDGVALDGVVGVHHLAAAEPGELGRRTPGAGGAVEVLVERRVDYSFHFVFKSTWTEECG